MRRWQQLTETLPEEHGGRLHHGHYTVGFQIIDDFDPPHGADLLEALRQGELRYTGWPPFWVPDREGIAPYIWDDNVECWIGGDGEDRDPATSDYWRVSPHAQFFLIRGYQEDAAHIRGIEPGTVFLRLPGVL